MTAPRATNPTRAIDMTMTKPLIPHYRRYLITAIGFLLAGGATMLLGCGDDSTAEATHYHTPDELAASHILVAYQGARNCPAGLTRTREKAHERARRIAVLLRTGRGDLGDYARRKSDDPTAVRNSGNLGSFRLGELEPALEEALLALEVGEIGGPVETSNGWHVIRRDPVRVVRIHHLLVAYRDANQACDDVERDRPEAARLARAIYHKATCDHVDLCDLTEQFSDDSENRLVCGDLGWIEPGLLERDVEQAIFELQPGQVTRVLESGYGFHIFWRE